MAKVRVAILGGGAGALSTAWHLTRTPQLRARFEVTVHQMGWRLGGQGASGRNREHHDRIEEHGLHIWLGFYENAFRMMRDCYAEWAKARDNPLQDWTDAFKPQTHTPLGLGDGHTFFQFEWPTNRDVPGDGGVALSPWGAITEAFNTLRIILGQVIGRLEAPSPSPFRIIGIVLGSALRLAGRLIKDLFAGRRSVADTALKLRAVAPLFTPARSPAEHMTDVFSTTHAVATGHGGAGGFTRAAAADLLWLLEEAQRLFHRLFGTSLNTPHGSLVWRVLDMALATLRGLLNPVYGLEEDLDLDRLDDYEFLDWLVANGADPNIRDLSNAPELRALYDLAFSYRPTPNWSGARLRRGRGDSLPDPHPRYVQGRAAVRDASRHGRGRDRAALRGPEGPRRPIRVLPQGPQAGAVGERQLDPQDSHRRPGSATGRGALRPALQRRRRPLLAQPPRLGAAEGRRGDAG